MHANIFPDSGNNGMLFLSKSQEGRSEGVPESSMDFIIKVITGGGNENNK